MGKNKEYTPNGVREFYSVKGCHSCIDCRNLVYNGKGYKCSVFIGKSTEIDARFPYDNTRCKRYEE